MSKVWLIYLIFFCVACQGPKSKEIKLKDNKCSQNLERLNENNCTKLPFDARFKSHELSNILIGPFVSNKLVPCFDTLKYIFAHTDRPINCHSKKLVTRIEDIFNFSTYQYRFPKYGKYDCILICDSSASLYKIRFANCPKFFHRISAYLIFYDLELRMGYVIEVLALNYPNKFYRNFRINSDYSIEIFQYNFIEDWDESKLEETLSEHWIIKPTDFETPINILKH